MRKLNTFGMEGFSQMVNIPQSEQSEDRAKTGSATGDNDGTGATRTPVPVDM